MAKLLIVDDEPSVAKLVDKVASGCGFAVTTTHDAEAFMDAVVASEPEAIVLDLSLPGTDGIELLRFLATIKSRARILIVSGFDQRVLDTAQSLGKALGLSIAGALYKPLRVAEMKKCVARSVRSSVVMKRTPYSRAAIEKATSRGELFLAYQPKLELRSGRISGVEALARWNHPGRGAIPPGTFIPELEANGAIDWFTEWALGSAIQSQAEWLSEGLDLELAVNISALNLKDVHFPDRVSRLCQDRQVPPDRLMLELTEGATQEAVRLMDTIARLRLKVIGISLDDFGTGFGSLVQLRSLPFTELKIDQSFVRDLLTSRDSRAITRALINLAHELGLSVTAEGVEDEGVLQALVAFGCDKAQGYYIARPMPADQLSLWIRNWAMRDGMQAASTPANQPSSGLRSAG